jgi:phage terminase large subunit GpA-like protein
MEQVPPIPKGLANALDTYWAAFAQAIRPEPDMTVSQWADSYRMLSPKASAAPGPWRTSRTPYLREIMDCLSPSHPCSEVTFKKGVQIGGSEAGFNWIGAVIDLWPGPAIMVLPTEGVAKAQVRQRIDTMIDSTPRLREKVSEVRSRSAANTATEKDFPGGVLYVAWATSAAGLASKPIRYVYADEIDKYPANVGGEGDPLVLVEKRANTFARRKIFRCSSPVEKGGRIDRHWEASDQRHYHVPCPQCGHEQWLKWGQMRWKLREVTELACTVCGVTREQETAAAIVACAACGGAPEAQRMTTRDTEHVERAWIECEGCQQSIEERNKTAMLEAGHWVAHRPGPGRPPGFQLSALYSPIGWFSWVDAVRQWIAAAADTTGELEKTFVNTVLGEGSERKGEKIGAESLRSRIDGYRLGTVVPGGALMLTAAVDVQGDRLEYAIKGWGRGEESWLVDWGQIYGDPSRTGEGSVWGELEKLLHRSYPHESGATLRVAAMAIDSGDGNRTQEVYLFCSKWSRRHVFAVKGASTARRPILGRPSEVDITHRGRTIKRGARVFLVGTDTAKDQIHHRLALRDCAGALHFPQGLPDSYFEEFTAERRAPRYVKGFVVFEWIKNPGARNEAWDLEVYNLAAAHYAGVTRIDWDRLEDSIRQMGLFAARSADSASPVAPVVSEEPAAVEMTPAGESDRAPDRAQAPRRNTKPPRSSWVSAWGQR